VAQLLAFSRKQIIDPQVLDLNAVVAQTDKMLQRTLGEDIKIRTLLASDLWPIKVDPAQIEQTLVNLAVNARDAMPAGGQLTIETANVVLDKDYVAQHFETRPGQYVLLAVSDTGMGMSRDVLAHIFEPFFTTKEQGKGTGLGLATVFGIVKQNGGDIQVYSEEGVGTTFKIYLPRAEAAPAAATPKEQIDDIPRGTETILLVEDEPVVREVVRRVLHEQGYTLLEAQDAQEALHLAARFSGTIHLLLTDVVMPGMSGKALAQQLTQTYPKLKILFMSGYTDNAIVHHGVLEPGTAFIHKPFSAAALARKVRRVLDAGSAKQPS
jgi:CheY-like chemotaxis protein